MIVCHCNRIDHVEITRAAEGLAEEHPWTLITPVAVYKHLGVRPRCGGCLTLAARVIHGLSIADAPRCSACPLAAEPGHECPHARASSTEFLVAAE